MSLLWRGVSALLLIEIVLLLILCAPLPWGVRKNISRWIFRARIHAKLDVIVRYVFFTLVLALVESVHSLRNVHIRSERKLDAEAGGGADTSIGVLGLHDFRWQKARAERNIYLASFAIFALLAIWRFVQLAAVEVQLRNKIKDYNGNKPLTETGETVGEKRD